MTALATLKINPALGLILGWIAELVRAMIVRRLLQQRLKPWNPRPLVLILAVSAFAVPVLADAPVAPYAGQQTRTIKALSPADVAALLKGEGMGMAKAAELNGYPGPLHVLTLSQELKLTETQRKQVQATFDRMSTAAKPLGSELVQHEQALDQLFVKQEITPDLLAGFSPDKVDACVWALTDLLVEPMSNSGIFELYREQARKLAEANVKPAPITNYAPGSVEWENQQRDGR